MIEGTQAIGAIKIHSQNYVLDGPGYLRCRHCDRRVEPSMARIHARAIKCRHHRAMTRVKKLLLVEVPECYVADLDAAGLCCWLETKIDPDTDELLTQAWVKPRILAYIRNQSTHGEDYRERCIEKLSRLSMMSEREMIRAIG